MWEPLKEEKIGCERMKQGFCLYNVGAKVLYIRNTALFYSLESECAAIKFPSCLKTGLFERRAADQQELMGCVHELKLLLCAKR